LASDAGSKHVDEQSSSLGSRSGQEAVVSQQRLKIGIAAILALALFAGGRASAGDFVFVRNAANDTAQAGKEEMRDVFTGKKTTWKGGQKVELGLAPSGSSEIKWLAQELIGASEDILLSKIKQEVFKGDMKKPAPVGSAAECIAFVKKAAGGVCVVDADSAKSLPDGVAVLKYTK
jgi:ABC-type phosphate transport system substrate-binding protein